MEASFLSTKKHLQLLHLFCVALFCSPLLPINSQAQPLQTLIAQGDSAYAAFDNERALQHYRRALTLDSTSFDARLRVSRTSYDYGLDLVARGEQPAAYASFEDAILHAKALVTLFPDSAQSHFMLAATSGNLAIFKGGREKILLGRIVEEQSKRAIALNPSLAYPYVSLGIYYRELSRLNWFEAALAKVFFGRLPDASFDDALTLLDKALQLKPRFPFLHFELAMTYLSIDQPARAVRHLKTLIALKPENSQDVRNQVYARELLDDIERGVRSEESQ